MIKHKTPLKKTKKPGEMPLSRPFFWLFIMKTLEDEWYVDTYKGL